MKRIFLFLVISAFAFASCKKDKKDDGNTCSLSEANIIGNTYKITSVKIKASEAAPEQEAIDIVLDPCEKDDTYLFNSDHTYTYTDAGTACSPNGSYTSDWTLSGSNFSTDEIEGTVENFSCNSFNAVETDSSTPGFKVTTTFTKQ